MDENFNLNSETLSGVGSDELVTSGGQETVSNVATEALTLEELNKSLGKNFTDKASAIKAFKDTFSYVGKLGQEVAQLKQKVNTPTDVVTRAELETELFYKDNPQYAEHRDLLEAIAMKNGIGARDAVQHPSFAKVFEKAQGYDKSQAMKSVLESNPRLGSARTKMQEAADSKAKGDSLGAASAAVSAVLEAYE